MAATEVLPVITPEKPPAKKGLIGRWGVRLAAAKPANTPDATPANVPKDAELPTGTDDASVEQKEAGGEAAKAPLPAAKGLGKAAAKSTLLVEDKTMSWEDAQPIIARHLDENGNVKGFGID